MALNSIKLTDILEVIISFLALVIPLYQFIKTKELKKIEKQIADKKKEQEEYADSIGDLIEETARLERELDSYRGDESLDSVLRLLSENAKDSPKEKVIGRESK